ncbi:restriction endonuclease [Curtobacterium sp. MCBA15_004]|uniref:restriction endonuclease n=1 Tax=Curtobacterium sp. MCBA15_004 TaxID=1898733 RepID=UPI001114AC5A|nr:restriction endonuclease [Curtobacterium sp. MCBA15_004]WIA97026.1 hypothetical protein QOL16_01155 [Curtobacterium sp. MCBA15_004]
MLVESLPPGPEQKQQNERMPGRVPWERYDGDDVEAVAALFLMRDNPHAIRRLPAQGDHGIDVLVRNDDATLTVYQVKRYTEALNSDHKRSITKSWSRLRDHVEARNVTLRNWWVVRPRDATDGDENWLEDLTAGSGVTARWLGRSNLDAWTTKYPEVVDYYLNGGRLEAEEYALRALKAARLLSDGTDSFLEQGDVEEGLAGLFRTVNARDPHFRYEYSVRAERHYPERKFEQVPVDLVWRASAVRDNVEVITEVYRRYDLAVEDSPLQLDVVPEPVTGDQRQALRDYEEFGLPLANMPAKVTGTISGLGPTGPTTISSLPDYEGEHSGVHELTVTVAGEEPLEARAEMSSRVFGPAGQGWSWTGTVGGTARFSAYGNADKTRHGVAVEPFSIEGMTPVDADAALALLRVSLSAGTVVLTVPDGPVMLDMRAEPDAEHPNDERLTALQKTIQVVRALRTLQRFIPYPLRVPPREQLTFPEIDAWVRASELMTKRYRAATWEPFRFTPTAAAPSFPAEFAVTSPLAVRIAQRTWEFGWVRQHGLAVSGDLLADGQILLHPGADNMLHQVITALPSDIAHAGRMFFRSV